MPDHDGWNHIETIPSSLPPGYSIVWSDEHGKVGYRIVYPNGKWSTQVFRSIEDVRKAADRLIDEEIEVIKRRKSMNCDTGHLVTQEMLKKMDELHRLQYEAVPLELEDAAIRKLHGKEEAYVSLTSGGKLSRFAAQNRKQRRKMVAQSRKRNRS